MSSGPQPEEQGARPAVTGDDARDWGERAIALAAIEHALCEYAYLMLGAIPLPYQHTAGFDLSHLPESGDRPPSASVFGDAFEQAAGGNAEPAAQAFLDAVGNGVAE